MSTPDSDRLQQLLQFLKSTPEEPFLLFAIAKEYESLGAEEQCLEYYLLLQQKSPDYVGLYYHLGKLYERKEDFDQAATIYEKGMEIAKSQGDKHAFGELRGALEGL